MYLTREQATAELIKAGATAEAAGAVLDSALALYPQSARITFALVTGYRKGTILGAYYPGNPGIPEDLFTIGAW